MRYGFLISMIWFTAACTGGDTDEVKAGGEDQTVGAEIASDYNRQMNRARDVEIQLEAHKRDLDEAIEKQTNPDR